MLKSDWTVAESEASLETRVKPYPRSLVPDGSFCAAQMRARDAGYTLAELLVVVAIFSIVMILLSISFSRVVSSSGQIVKSEETDIGGLIELEVLRIDLGSAGFGLPWSLGGVGYSEADDHVIDGNADTNPSLFNDAPDRPPRAFVLAKDKGLNHSDYLVLKGTALGMTRSSRRWSYLNYSSTKAIIKPSKSELELDPKNGERVIVVNSGIRDGVPVRDLVVDGGSFSLGLDYTLPEAFRPKSRQDSYLVYGLAPSPEGSEDKITFPFNRADYYLGRSDASSTICAHGTGMLYRGQVSQKGNLKSFPILDCVADFQVVFLNGDGVATDIDFPDDAARQIREHVKEVRLYILAQQGKRTPDTATR